MGLLKLGSLIRYLSHSVMTGFTSAAGIYVGFTQLKYILDVHPTPKHYHFSQMIEMGQLIKEGNPVTEVRVGQG
jgi:sulfate permease, SulP family